MLLGEIERLVPIAISMYSTLNKVRISYYRAKLFSRFRVCAINGGLRPAGRKFVSAVLL
jgi:hypothetical protein